MNILLEPEQFELLKVLVETSRRIPRDRQRKFIVVQTFNSQSSIIHPGFGSNNYPAYLGDIEELGRKGLIHIQRPSSNSINFDITPEGFNYYNTLKQRAGESTRNIEASTREYLSSSNFQQKYPEVYQKWMQAEALLWSSDSEQQFTTIGHLCREAMQAFAAALIDQYKPNHVGKDPAKTVARIKAVIEHRASSLGSTEKHFLEMLIAYWGTVNDLVQRQEHGAKKESEVIVWEDGRRVVFQTMIVMYELDRSLSLIHN